MAEQIIKTTCFHCGEDCIEQDIIQDDKHFCCTGCQLVYELLEENNLCSYYKFSNAPGNTPKYNDGNDKFTFLEDQQLKQSLVSYTDGEETHITFYIPGMHCSSCVYLLEHLPRINNGVLRATVNFPKKELSVVYRESVTSVSSIAGLMAQLGYEPYFSLEQSEKKIPKKYNRSRIYKIGIAGFCFGNIMMLSFPEYFSAGEYFELHQLGSLFGYLNIILALPVFFYAASDFFSSGWKALRKGYLNIDLPIALAILVTFLRSLYEIISGTGAGYLDSMSGIVFLMLLGRFFQDRTYETLSFERDYKSYFPISVTQVKKEDEQAVPVANIRKGDHILIRNNELIPADAILLKGEAIIDYSFVTGEAREVRKRAGELVYAGGRQVGSAVLLETVREVSQSYLTRLWNNEVFTEQEHQYKSFINKVSKYFTLVLFLVTAFAFVYWMNVDVKRAWNAVTTTLIVACPCALLLSATFTNGNVMRIYGRHQFYVRNAGVIEKLNDIDVVVFDKTGTITEANQAGVTYTGSTLSATEIKRLKSCFSHSNHPLSRRIVSFLPGGKNMEVLNFREHAGRGISAEVQDHQIRMGSYEFIFLEELGSGSKDTRVYVEIDGLVKGFFTFRNVYRAGFEMLAARLKESYELMVLSGDHDAERSKLQAMLGRDAKLFFDQSPQDKLKKIETLQRSGKKVMMIGDGLNDSGALKQSEVGIAVSDNINNFSPACDVIMDGNMFASLDRFIRFSASARKVIIGSFIISLVYNMVGLFFAVQGVLSPLIAAILMPASSISIVLYSTLATNLAGRWILGKIRS